MSRSREDDILSGACSMQGVRAMFNKTLSRRVIDKTSVLGEDSTFNDEMAL
jgi:hypothetical protein